MSRAERRAARERMVNRAKRKLKEWGMPTSHPQKWADNMAKCSCWMCRGPARWTKPVEKFECWEIEA